MGRIVVSGHSAGGHLAACLSLRIMVPPDLETYFVDADAWPKAAVLFNPVTSEYHAPFDKLENTSDERASSLSPPASHAAVRLIFTGTTNAGYNPQRTETRVGWRSQEAMHASFLNTIGEDLPCLSPLMHVGRQKHPPCLLLHGDADQVVPVEQSRRYQLRLRQFETQCTLVEFPGRPHGFAYALESLHADFVDTCEATRDFLQDVRELRRHWPAVQASIDADADGAA